MTAHPLLYDPDCGFCRVCVAVVLTWDRHNRLQPVSLTSTEGEELLAGMPEDERMASWHLVDAGWSVTGAENATNPDHPEIWSGGAAFSPLFRQLPGATPLALLAEGFPDGFARAYRWVADRRSAFGRPLPAAARRWADRVISESARDSR